ncbi:hypothetical protein WDM22_00690 [Bradyrhizobium septentrionale]|uniref:hypothetical protein n=1 Tax=Bradyrhizobium septentrionale TaxID=1404411 RepID=UPI0030D1E96C
MSFKALLAARAHREGRAQPSAQYRHRAIAENPLCIVAWQLGAEPFSVGAIAFGTEKSGYQLFVPGYPLDRELLFAELTRLAQKFCPAFEAYMRGRCDAIEQYGAELQVPRQLPQIVVANVETIGLIGRLGRRLAYLPTTGDRAADPVLTRMGRHFMWLAEHSNFPGQQLVLSVTDLLTMHYATGMSSYETGSLAAMYAWINPGRGTDGFHAAEAAERQAVGPTPDPADGERIFDLMKAFNEARGGSRDPAVVRRHAKTLREFYDRMVDDTWSLVWEAIAHERGRPEAASVARRTQEDRLAYASHMSWMSGTAEGRRRTRMTSRSAAMRLNQYERAAARLEAEEAIDDPLRMVPFLLAGKAVAGNVVRSDPNRRELINGRNCKRPSVTLRTAEPCIMPRGTELWWTEMPNGREWLVDAVSHNGAGSDVTLVLQTNRGLDGGLPRVHQRVCFSQLNTQERYEVHLPQDTPWTHRTPQPPETDLEGGASGSEAA